MKISLREENTLISERHSPRVVVGYVQLIQTSLGARGINAIGQENDKTIVGRVDPNHGTRIASMTKSFRAYPSGEG